MTPAQQVFCYTVALGAFVVAAAWGFRSTTAINRIAALNAIGFVCVTLVLLWRAAERV